MLQIETSQQARQAGAAVESFRNEVVRSNSENQQLYLEYIKQQNEKVLPTTVTPLESPMNIIEPGEDA
jgi:capsule polysaccharide export protein KpsE/RkpR